ncbi:MAG TPA: D-alanine--D-alanine ligase, partial [Planctomycetaceae bacterium]|nr:D-alanine--D-alanine ligase [Planctomycetaceae bacterium]
GREITVALAGDRLLPLVEIVPPGNWYDYVAKYQSAATQYQVAPAGIPAALPVAAIQAVRAAGASDLTRTDIRLRPDGSFVILEINTIPGMTTHSLVPLAAAALGLTIGQLLEPLLQQKLGSDRSAA